MLLSRESFRLNALHPAPLQLSIGTAFKMLLAIFLLLGHALSAKTVDPATAMQVAKHFYQSTAAGRSPDDGNLQLFLAYGEENPDLTSKPNLLYIFNVNAGGGFVIVTADDAVEPVLGYSTTGAFDAADVPDNMAKWLEDYQHEILFVIQNGIAPSADIQQKWNALRSGPQPARELSGVGPLLTTTWNQNPYYNAQCPGGSVTGCAATAMAQVMKYWNYPATGAGWNSYVENDYGLLFVNFGAATYNWIAMPNNLQQNNSEVAKLMYHCGVSINTNYSPQSSGANPAYIRDAFVNYFKYSPGAQRINKNNYTPANWILALKAELDASRPIFYGGFGPGTGHAFVCDGYDDNNLFHINWGWGGSSNGYFSVQSMNPSATGTGGGTGGGYSTDQFAIVGLQPNSDQVNLQTIVPMSVFPDPLQWLVSYSVITSVQNISPITFNGQIGLGLFNEADGSLVKILHAQDVSLTQLDAVVPDFSGVVNFPAAHYLVAVMYKVQGSNQWTQVPNGNLGSYANFNVGSVGTIHMTAPLTANPSPVVSGAPLDLDVTITDPNGSATVDFAVNLWSADAQYQFEINRVNNVQIPGAGFNIPVHFHTDALNVPPGRYLITIDENDGTGWTQMNPFSFPTTITLDVLPAPILPDVFEENETPDGGHYLGLNFVNNVAYVNTEGSNIDSPDDNDYFYFVLDPGYTYTVKARVHDAYNSGNGQLYTNDVRWSYRAGTANNFSESYDDILLTPAMTFTTPSVDYVDFHIVPYFAGTLGTYLFEAEVTRTLISGTEDLLPEQTISVYPNPANQFTTISLLDPELTPKTIDLYNLEGQLVHTQAASKDQDHRILTGHLPNGTYLVSVVTESGVWNSKLNITHNR